MRSLDHEKGTFRVCGKVREVGVVNAQALFNRGGGTIAAAQPDHFGWMAEEETPLMKVGVFGDEGEALLGGVVPDGFVGGLTQSDVSHLL